MNQSRIEFKSDRHSVISNLIKYVNLILEPMKYNADEKHTSDMIEGVDGFSGILIDIPVMWLESIRFRLETSIGGELYISNSEIEILLSMLDFINSSELKEDDILGAEILLKEMAVVNNNHKGIHI